MPKVKLESTNKAPCRFEASLYHDVYCRRTGECTCQTRERLNKAGKPIIQHLPASFSISQGQKSGELHSAVLYIPQVKEWISRGYLKRHDVPDSSLPMPASASPTIEGQE